MKITAKYLEAVDDCKDQVALFRRHFGEEVEVSEKLCLAHAHEFDWNWAARRLLDVPTWQAYERATAGGWTAYEEAMVPARRAYEEVIAEPSRAFEEKATAE